MQKQCVMLTHLLGGLVGELEAPVVHDLGIPICRHYDVFKLDIWLVIIVRRESGITLFHLKDLHRSHMLLQTTVNRGYGTRRLYLYPDGSIP